MGQFVKSEFAWEKFKCLEKTCLCVLSTKSPLQPDPGRSSVKHVNNHLSDGKASAISSLIE
jgi:hypothetical protein